MKVEVDLRLLSKEQLIQLIESGALATNEHKVEQNNDNAEPMLNWEPDKKRYRRQIVNWDARIDKVAEYLQEVGKPVPLTETMQKLGIPHEGASHTKFVQKAKRSKKFKIDVDGVKYIAVPRGVEFTAESNGKRDKKPESVSESDKTRKSKRKGHRTEYNLFMSKRIPHYIKLGHYRGDAFRLAVADWHKFKAGTLQEKVFDTRKPVTGKSDEQKKRIFPVFDSLDNTGNNLVKNMLFNAMNINAPLTFGQDGQMLGIENYGDWIRFANEVVLYTEIIKDYFGVISNRKWQYNGRALWFK